MSAWGRSSGAQDLNPTATEALEVAGVEGIEPSRAGGLSGVEDRSIVNRTTRDVALPRGLKEGPQVARSSIRDLGSLLEGPGEQLNCGLGRDPLRHRKACQDRIRLEEHLPRKHNSLCLA